MNKKKKQSFIDAMYEVALVSEVLKPVAIWNATPCCQYQNNTDMSCLACTAIL